MARKFPPLPWISQSVIYEVNVRQYTAEGTFQSFAQHLPRLFDMGVNVFWFMPIYPISLEGRKGSLGSYYSIQNYRAVNSEFGSIEEFKSLVDQIHFKGGKVILDWVANHTGLDHVWTKSHPGAYMKDAKGNFYERNGWEDVIDLNYYDAQMRTLMKEDMLYWVKECDIDGFRCDMAHLVPLDFWLEARTYIDSYKPLLWFAETETKEYLDVFDIFYAWKWLHSTESYVKGNLEAKELYQLEVDYNHYAYQGCYPMFFTSNHDENSWNGTEYDRYGNQALTLAEKTFQMNGVPLIYSGQELPLKRSLAFFDKDQIEWEEGIQLHEFYKECIKMFRNRE